MNNLNDNLNVEEAKKQVAKIKSFYTHLFIYGCSVLLFLTINLIIGGFFWAIFPITAWGLGILGHAADTFQWNPFFNKEWEQRKIKEFLEKE